MKNVIIISGKARSGKNTISEFIEKYFDELNIKYIETSYAKYLKLNAHEITGWDYDEDTKPRDLLQNIGNILRKEIGSEDILVKRIITDIKLYLKFADVVILTDARFPSEIDDITKSFNALSLRVVREKESDLNTKQKNDITETSMDDYHNYDYVILNNSDLDTLKIKINEIMEENYELKR